MYFCETKYCFYDKLKRYTYIWGPVTEKEEMLKGVIIIYPRFIYKASNFTSFSTCEVIVRNMYLPQKREYGITLAHDT